MSETTEGGTGSVSIPLSVFQARDVVAFIAQKKDAQRALDIIAQTIIGGQGIDPATFTAHTIAFTDAALVITPQVSAPALVA